jgi:hypothetical protein
MRAPKPRPKRSLRIETFSLNCARVSESRKGHRRFVLRMTVESQRSSMVMAVIRAGGVVALVRLAVFWAGLAMYWRQDDPRLLVAGYALLILNSPLEVYIATTLTRGNQTGWALLVSALIVLTSSPLGLAWAWLRSR